MEPTIKSRSIAAAVDLFSQQGYTETSSKQIAGACGVRTTSICFHFASKPAILGEIMHSCALKAAGSIPTRADIVRMVRKRGAREVLTALFFAFDSEDAGLCLIMIRVILQEQCRNPQAADFVCRHRMVEVERYVACTLESLQQAGKIGLGDCRIRAKLINALNLQVMAEYAHQAWEAYEEMGTITRWDTLQSIFNLLTDNAEHKEGTPSCT